MCVYGNEQVQTANRFALQLCVSFTPTLMRTKISSQEGGTSMLRTFGHQGHVQDLDFGLGIQIILILNRSVYGKNLG